MNLRFHVTPHKWIVYGGRRKRQAEKRLILCRTVPFSGNHTPFSGPSDMFSGDLVMDCLEDESATVNVEQAWRGLISLRAWNHDVHLHISDLE